MSWMLPCQRHGELGRDFIAFWLGIKGMNELVLHTTVFLVDSVALHQVCVRRSDVDTICSTSDWGRADKIPQHQSNCAHPLGN